MRSPTYDAWPLFLLFFIAVLIFVAFAQIYLLCKLYRFLRTCRLHPRLRRLLSGTVCTLFVLPYLPYPLRLFYKWPEHEVSVFMLYGLFYAFSLWGMASVSTFLIVLLKNAGTAAYRVWKHPSPPSMLPDIPLRGSSLATRREFLRWAFGAVAVAPVGVFTYGAAVGKERYEIVEHTIMLPRLSLASMVYVLSN